MKELTYPGNASSILHTLLRRLNTHTHAPTRAIEAHAALPLRVTNSKHNKRKDCQSRLVYPKALVPVCVSVCVCGCCKCVSVCVLRKEGGSVYEHLFVLGGEGETIEGS